MTPGILLAAALVLDMKNKVVAPGVGGRIVIQTQALQAGSDQGAYQIKIFENDKEKKGPGKLVEDVRVRPSTVFLRDNKPRRVTLSIRADAIKEDTIWLCISEKEKPSSIFRSGSATLNITTQSCYQRLVRK